MTRALFTDEPATVIMGGKTRGRQILFVNLAVKAIEATESHETNETSEHKYESTCERLVLNEMTIASFVNAVSSDFLVLATEEETLAIMSAFGAQDDLESWKAMRTAQINAYDTSDNVNSFELSGKQMWLNKDTRVGLVNSISIEKAAGKENTTLWFGGNKYELPVDTAMQMLSALELYALECYNVTQKHLAAVSEADDVEELKAYEYKNNYPEVLSL